MLPEQFPPTVRSHPTWPQRISGWAARMMFNAVVIVAFTLGVAGAIWAFYNGYRVIVAGGALLLFMAAAFSAGRDLRERICLSLCVPFAALGGYVGFRVYFAMFELTWFERIFNSKEAGPFGLILFVVGFAIAALLLAGYLMDRANRQPPSQAR